MGGAEDFKKCRECEGQCCRSVAVKLEEPEDINDYEDFKWFIYHPGLTVYLDDEGDWHVDMPIKCRHLDAKGACKIYKDRPPVCRDYDVKDCMEANDQTVELKTPADVDKYIAKLRKEGEFDKDGKVRK